ncbi:hypothetical protein Zmor_009425 [Zophobas morio]|uniref:Uncharacterized protein n=1 Tax=Zophobas morio TaxID=2755281 RepID=A0AA38MIS8_9CUCU|nr:hypothetical protein Zmor_009425 [Zophobas morio]
MLNCFSSSEFLAAIVKLFLKIVCLVLKEQNNFIKSNKVDDVCCVDPISLSNERIVPEKNNQLVAQAKSLFVYKHHPPVNSLTTNSCLGLGLEPGEVYPGVSLRVRLGI